MNVLWHLIRKDLRTLRWPITGYALVILGKCLVGELLFAAIERGQRAPLLSGASPVITLVECLAAVFILARLIHLDHPAGPDAFWSSRPISRGRLLVAKLATAFLVLGILPCLLLLPWWLAHPVGLSGLVSVVGEHLGVQFVLLVPTFTLAANTLRLTTFITAWLVAVLGIAGNVALVSLVSRRVNGDPSEEVASAIYFGLLVASALIGLCSFFKPRRRLHLGLLAVAVVTAVTSALLAPKNLFSGFRDERPATASILGVQTPQSPCSVDVTVRFDPLATDEVIEVDSISPTLHQTRLAAMPLAGTEARPQGIRPRVTSARWQEPPPLPKEPPLEERAGERSGSQTLIAQVDSAGLSPRDPNTSTLGLFIGYRQYRIVPLGELVVDPQATLAAPSKQIRVVDWSFERGQLTVTLIFTGVATQSFGSSNPLLRVLPLEIAGTPIIAWLQSADRKATVPSKPGVAIRIPPEYNIEAMERSARVAGVAIARFKLRFSDPAWADLSRRDFAQLLQTHRLVCAYAPAQHAPWRSVSLPLAEVP